MMATLHGILAELGLAQSTHPTMPADSAQNSQWTTEPRFDPVEGASYELAFTRIPLREKSRPVIKRVRIDGPGADEWFDLDAQQPLDRALYAYAVKAYRRLDTENKDANYH